MYLLLLGVLSMRDQGQHALSCDQIEHGVAFTSYKLCCYAVQVSFAVLVVLLKATATNLL